MTNDLFANFTSSLEYWKKLEDAYDVGKDMEAAKKK